MKRLSILFSILTIGLLSHSQSTNMEITYDMTLGDTVIQVGNMIDVTGFNYSVDVYFPDTELDFEFSIQSGNIESDPLEHIFLTNPTYDRIFPLTIHPEQYVMKLHRFISFEGYSGRKPVLVINPDPTDTSTITIKLNFFR